MRKTFTPNVKRKVDDSKPSAPAVIPANLSFLQDAINTIADHPMMCRAYPAGDPTNPTAVRVRPLHTRYVVEQQNSDNGYYKAIGYGTAEHRLKSEGPGIQWVAGAQHADESEC